MSQTTRPTVRLDQRRIGVLRAHPVVANALPPRDVEWARAESVCEQYDVEPAPAVVRPMVDRLDSLGLIDVTRRVTVRDEHTNHPRNVYRTASGVAAWVDQHVEVPETFPCGHQGVRNLGGGRFACGRESCDRVFDRETAAAVLGRRSA